VRFYPSRGVTYESHLTPPPHLTGLRVAALDALAEANPIVVVSAVALSEKVPDPSLRPHSLRIERGDLLDLDELAGDLVAAGYERVVHLGSGSLAALAQEASLKLLELTAGGVVSLAESSLGFRHGPKAVLRPGTLAVVHSSGDPYTGAYDDDIVAELAASLGDEHVLVLAGHGRPAAHAGPTWRLPRLDGAPDVALALPYAVVAQSLALRTSLARGLTPDNPFPGGAVNRVVQGVTVHPLPPG
jgi:tagatose-6-phosphate ketose/aldose isomerase